MGATEDADRAVQRGRRLKLIVLEPLGGGICQPDLKSAAPVATLAVLSSLIEDRDPFARGHSSRVAVLAHSLARRIGFDRQELVRLRLGALLHDIGKLAVPEAVLLKPGALNELELAQIRRHPGAGARMLRAIGAALDAVPGVLFHHERWDGGGYPAGRAGKEIPLDARILAVADSFDAMTSVRPYRGPRPAPDALDELERCAGSQFDPVVVGAFLAACLEGDLGWSTEESPTSAARAS